MELACSAEPEEVQDQVDLAGQHGRAAPGEDHPGMGTLTGRDGFAAQAVRRENSCEVSGTECQDDDGRSDQLVEGPSRGPRTTRSTR